MNGEHRTSYLKTSLLALAVGAGVVVAAYTLAPTNGLERVLIIAAAWLVAAPALCVTAGGAVVLYRDKTQVDNRVELFRALSQRRSDIVLAQGARDAGLWLRGLVRRLRGSRRLLVGDMVEIRSYEEIRTTLDAGDCLSGLPFQPEMKRFCGQRARVFRCVDKIYDYGRTKDLRRLEDAFLLVGLRCDGSAHGGCQAGCYLMWKSAWLKPVAGAAMSKKAACVSSVHVDASAVASHSSPQAQYKCQFTELAAASTDMSPWDIRQDVRPLLSGNVTVAGFCVVVLTRLFNFVQHLRGGSGYPSLARPTLSKTPAVTHGLKADDWVRVCGPEQITRTLDKTNKNRGLWFDPDMVKHCGKTYQVLKRVDHIIDDVTGHMRVMKSPCIVLRGVDYSGEFLRFCAQEEPLYWREAWLSPLEPTAEIANANAVDPQRHCSKAS